MLVRHRSLLNLQRQRNSLPIWSCSVWGLPCPPDYSNGGALLPHLFTLTPPPQSGQQRRYVFCGTFRQPALTPASRTLSGTLLCGVRTFLPHHLTRRERPSGPAANWFIIFDPDSRLRTLAALLLDFNPSSRLTSHEHRRSHPHRLAILVGE